MKAFISRLAGFVLLMSLMPAASADSYRYMHVTIDTPWVLFLFLLVAVLMPFILMAILYWHNAMRRNAEDDAKGEE